MKATLRAATGGQLELGVHDHHADGRTSLHSAAAAGQVEDVRMLAARGVDVRVQDEDGKTALYEAAYYGQVQVQHVLACAPLTTNIIVCVNIVEMCHDINPILSAPEICD
jgi:ankyrin repeat protein